MAYLNKVMLIGNIGKEPEFRTTQSGIKQAKFSLATTEKYRDKNSGETKERTDWHNIVAWRFPADQMERLQIKKGTPLYLEGRLTTRSYDAQDGTKKYVTEIEVERFQLLGSRPQGDRPAYPSNNFQASPSQNSAPAFDDAPTSSGGYGAGFEDEQLPF